MNKIISIFFILILLYNSDKIIAQDLPVDTTIYQTQEIVITGTRTDKRVIDIPYSVDRIDKLNWESSPKKGIDQVLQFIPGLFMQSRYGNHDVRISIRGFGSRSNSGIRGVRILLDGIPESEPDGQTRIESIDFTSLGKVEVVKGNASSLYTNAPGGVINFISDISFSRTFILSDNEIGDYGYRKNGIKFGLNSDYSRFMMNVSYENYDGFRQHSNENQIRINSAFQTSLSAVTNLSIYGYYVDGLIKLPGSQTLAQYNADPFASDSVSQARDLKRITKKGRVAITLNTKFGTNENNVFEITAYGTIKDLTRTDSRYRIFNRNGLGASFKYINYSMFGDYSNEFSFGGDYYWQGGPMNFFTNVNGQKGDIAKAITNETIINLGFYAIDQFYLIPSKLSVLLTARYDRVLYDSQDLLNSSADTTRLFDRVTPKFALNYKFTPNIAAYASFGLGFDTPANNEMSNPPNSSNPNITLNPDLKPQLSQNFEIGFKGDLPSIKNKYFKNTFAEITFFNLNIEDEIVPYVVDNTYYYRNAGKTRRTGVEFGFSSEIVKGLSIRMSYTFSDFIYKEYELKTVVTSPFKDTVVNYSNNVVPSVPKHNINLEIGYQYTMMEYHTFFIKGNYKYIGSMFVNDQNSAQVDNYNLLAAQLGYKLNYKNWSLLAYAGMNNIADIKYVSFININDAGGAYYEAGPGRNFFSGLTFGYTFLR